MPVGTQATVKGISRENLLDLDVKIIFVGAGVALDSGYAFRPGHRFGAGMPLRSCSPPNVFGVREKAGGRRKGCQANRLGRGSLQSRSNA